MESNWDMRKWWEIAWNGESEDKWWQLITNWDKLRKMGANGNKGDKTSRDKWHVDAIQIETDAAKICWVGKVRQMTTNGDEWWKLESNYYW